ncbi:hypothetical protein [Wenyingzhuangia marina]|uniref:Uncharacterized protein n=1 Tax=Wenyingzhuangia marina TaxID=1195760 RepID=A0A1M5V8U7_9FLAO|nr:hypothetical protein [Wenyingzhuangia marina]GGF73711.1 hypothetical protein GCM10011397_15800 [Wenyingzhuangia marina]SHH71514.1 hypothetical protein SAMN05444281_1599 [Wenyingzhuangia marina]
MKKKENTTHTRKKSTSIFIAFALLVFTSITAFYIDTKIHGPEREEANKKNAEIEYMNAELSVAYENSINNRTNGEKWRDFITVVKKNKNITINSYTSAEKLYKRADYILNNYKYFNDLEALKIITKQYERIYNQQKSYFNEVYINLLYELGDAKKAQKVAAFFKEKKMSLIPKHITKWMNSELAKNTKKPLVNLNSNDFFKEGNATIVGYIDYYNGNQELDFTTVTTYLKNYFTNENFIKTSPIEPDGRFTIKLPLHHPIHSSLLINNKFVEFYIEPGQTLGIILNNGYLLDTRIDVKKIPEIIYQGSLAEVNDDLSNFIPSNYEPYKFYELAEKLDPLPFKEQQLKNFKEDLKDLEIYTQKRGISEKTKNILKSNILVYNYGNLLDYTMIHPFKESYQLLFKDNNNFKIKKLDIPDAYYHFLKDIPLNEHSFLMSPRFSQFINRLEFTPCFMVQNLHYAKNVLEQLKYQTKAFHLTDSLANSYDINPSDFVYEMIKIRNLNSYTNIAENKEKYTKYWQNINKNEDPIFKKTAKKIIKGDSESIKKLSINTQATKVFNKLTKGLRDKKLVVILWNELKSPYLKKEMYNKIIPASKKYEKEANFLFITSPEYTSEGYYKKFTRENNLKNSIRISEDEMNYINELFQNTSMTFTAVIDKEDNILYLESFATFYDFDNLKSKN